jgi:hypothetical protein
LRYIDVVARPEGGQRADSDVSCPSVSDEPFSDFLIHPCANLLGGLWQVIANYDVLENGTWVATSESADHYKIGDEVPFNTTRYSSIMSIWVK